MKKIVALVRRNWIVFGATFILGVLPLACIISLVLQQNEPYEFCSTKDGIYQYIKSNKDIWITDLSKQTPTAGGNYKAFDVWTTDRRYNLVRPYYSYKIGSPEFYVITESLWPGTQSYGSRGYWYAPGKDMLISSTMRYQPLENDIYCYWYR